MAGNRSDTRKRRGARSSPRDHRQHTAQDEETALHHAHEAPVPVDVSASNVPVGGGPLKTGETERLAALQRYDILDTDTEAAYDELTRLAAQLCDSPIALISLLDGSRQWFKSRIGLEVSETPREVAFCDHAIRGNELFEVADARDDDRFRENPLVTDEPHIRFYAGVPLATPDGHNLGTLCVIDRKPRTLEPFQREALASLSRQVIVLFELRRALATQRHLETFARESIDAMSDNIAVIDRSGAIVRVNRAWTRFAEQNANAVTLTNLGVGVNYLDVCDRAAARGSKGAAEIAATIRKAFAGHARTTPGLEYPCHAPQEKRWFIARVSIFETEAGRFALISHHDISARKLAEQQVHEQNQMLKDRARSRSEELLATHASLRASETRFRRMFENAAVGIASATPEGRLIQANAAFCDIVGRTDAELEGRHIRELIEPGDFERVQAQRELLLSGTIPGFECEMRFRRPAGEVVWVHSSVAAVRAATGPMQTVALVQDITSHKRAEYERDSFFKLSVDMLTIADFEQRLHRVNPAWTRVLGFSERELTRMNYFDLLHEDDVDTARDHLRLLASGKAPDTFLDVRMRTREGGYRDVRWSAAPWEEEGLMVAVGRDVTRIRAAEFALRERDAMLARAEEMAAMGSWTWAGANDRVISSQGLLRITARSPAEAPHDIGQFLQTLAEEHRATARATIEGVMQRGAPASFECRIRRPDGEYREILSFIEPRREPDGEIVGVSGACLDVTGFKRAEARALISERDLRALAARLQTIREEERTRISREIHDELGQMLTALRMDLTLFTRDVASGNLPTDRERTLQELNTMVELVDATLQSVRRIARALRPEVLDVLGLVPALEWQAEELQARTGLRCTVQAPDDLGELDSGCSTELFRIVQEALTNIVRHARATNAAIALRGVDDRLVLTVADDGQGFDPARLSVPSLGVLGMRERAAGIGAHLQLDSLPGEGTTVILTIPSRALTAGAHHR